MTESHVPIETLLRHAEWVNALARRLVSDDATADDVVQETWLAALRRPPRPGSARAWLGTVVRNAARQRARSESRRGAYEDAAPPRSETRAAVEVVARADAHRHVVIAVMALDEPYRSTVLMRFFDGLSAAEIAARTGVPVETVRTRTKRAVARLRSELDTRSGGDDRAWRAALAPLLSADCPRLPMTGAGAGTAATAGVGAAAMGVMTKVGLVAVLCAGATTAWWMLGGDEAGEAPPVETSGANVAAPGDDPDEGGRARVNLPPAERPSDTKGGGTSLADIIDALPGGSVDVRTAAGEPVANAEVIVFRDGSTFARGTTDESGSAGTMSAGDGARILVIAPGRPAVIADPTDDGDTVVIVPDGLVVEGLVRVDGAAPREPIQLTLRADLPVIRRGDVPNDLRSLLRRDGVDPDVVRAHVASDGRFRFEGLPRETSARLDVPSGYEIGGGPATRVDIPSSNLLLELTAFPIIRGRVITPQGQPVASARVGVKVSDENGVGIEVVRHADRIGRFEVAVPVRHATGIEMQVSGPDGMGEVVVKLGAVEPGLRDVGDVRLAEVRHARLVVRDTSGDPIDAAVVVAPYGTKPLAGPSSEDGVLRVPLRDGQNKLVVGALGYTPVERHLAAGDAGPMEVELAAAALLGVAVSSATDLPAGLRLVVRSGDGENPVAFDSRLASVLVAAGAARRDDDQEIVEKAEFLVPPGGAAQLASLRANAELALHLVDALGIQHAERRVTLTAGVPTDIDLRVEVPVRTFRGRVVGPDGAGIAGANVRLNSADHEGGPLVVTADVEGRFEIAGVAATKARLLVVAERHAMRNVEDVPVTDDEQEIRLQPASTLRLNVIDAEGAPVTRAIVSMRLPPEKPGGTMLSRLSRRVDDGVYELRDVPHVDVTVTVRAGGTSQTFTVNGSDGETTLRLLPNDE